MSGRGERRRAPRDPSMAKAATGRPGAAPWPAAAPMSRGAVAEGGDDCGEAGWPRGKATCSRMDWCPPMLSPSVCLARPRKKPPEDLAGSGAGARASGARGGDGRAAWSERRRSRVCRHGRRRGGRRCLRRLTHASCPCAHTRRPRALHGDWVAPPFCTPWRDARMECPGAGPAAAALASTPCVGCAGVSPLEAHTRALQPACRPLPFSLSPSPLSPPRAPPQREIWRAHGDAARGDDQGHHAAARDASTGDGWAQGRGANRSRTERERRGGEPGHPATQPPVRLARRDCTGWRGLAGVRGRGGGHHLGRHPIRAPVSTRARITQGHSEEGTARVHDGAHARGGIALARTQVNVHAQGAHAAGHEGNLEHRTSVTGQARSDSVGQDGVRHALGGQSGSQSRAWRGWQNAELGARAPEEEGYH
mmetsp:Transcript_10269/g.30441  ORF Transcript_10269/g.30441 Transcript_10269/m.30441 type:complete len:422 (-) Transcript_10269:112-1377(-)